MPHLILALWWWIEVHTGTVHESGPYYGFWSGFGSDLGELALLGAIGGIWHKHNCHAHGCLRVGRHVVDGSPWCNQHHIQARTDLRDTGSAHTLPPQQERGHMSDETAVGTGSE